MTARDCSECGKPIEVEQAYCPACGRKAGSVQKAAAGLETLITLGDVIHDSDPNATTRRREDGKGGDSRKGRNG